MPRRTSSLVVTGLGDPNVFRFVHGVAAVEYSETSRDDTVRLRITPKDTMDLGPALLEYASEKGWKVREMSIVRPTLEDLFVQITEEDEVSAGGENRRNRVIEV